MLRGDTVVLRPIRAEDLPALYASRIDLGTWLDADDNPPRPVTFEEFREIYERITRDPHDTEWAIEAGGELVGRCALYRVDPVSRHAELGITVNVGQRGRGYGRAAVALLLDYAFAKRNLHRVMLETLDTNVAGQRAYAAAGFVEEGRLRSHAWVDGRYHDVVLMSVLRPEWEARRG